MSIEMLTLLIPEITLLVGACVVLFTGSAKSVVGRSSSGLVALLFVLFALAYDWYAGPPETIHEFAGLQVTSLSWYVRIIALGVGLLVLLVNWNLSTERDRGELLSMILFSLAGILLTSLADDLIVLFLAIELVSVPTYILVSVGRGDIRAQEAGVKYFFLGALSSALMIYGFSFLYGAAGTTSLTEMNFDGSSAYLTLGLLLAFAGIAYKIAAVPFHVYAADVYQGASASVTGLLGFFPKLAGFVALIKLLTILPDSAAGPGWNMPAMVFIFLWIVALATMTIGNVVGLMQSSAKRILAYSSIAHSGYMLLALLVGPTSEGGPFRDGLSAMLFYIAVYGFMNLGAFAVFALLRTAEGKEVDDLSDLAGLARRQPWLALCLAICLFSLMGLPLTAGFLGKIYIFTAAFSVGADHPHQQAIFALGIFGVLNAAVAAAYYLRIISACYVSESQDELVVDETANGPRVGVAVCSFLVLLVGIWPNGLIQLTSQSMSEVQEIKRFTVEAGTAQEVLAPAEPTTDTRPADLDSDLLNP